MREIKFRGRHLRLPTLLGDWIYGSLYSDGADDHEPMIIEAEGEGRYYPVAPATVGQFTGLKDYKGREIYEGDIVKVVSYGEESFHVVKYMIDLDYPAFDLEPALDGDFNSLSYSLNALDTKIIVIGNIHDNPELLRLTKTGGFEK